MPVLPGSDQPLALTAGGAKTKNKGRGGKTNQKADEGDQPKTPKRKRKGDAELHQLDLKRHQISLRRTAVAWF